VQGVGCRASGVGSGGTLRWTVSRETVDFVDADGAVAEDEMDLAG